MGDETIIIDGLGSEEVIIQLRRPNDISASVYKLLDELECGHVMDALHAVFVAAPMIGYETFYGYEFNGHYWRTEKKLRYNPIIHPGIGNEEQPKAETGAKQEIETGSNDKNFFDSLEDNFSDSTEFDEEKIFMLYGKPKLDDGVKYLDGFAEPTDNIALSMYRFITSALYHRKKGCLFSERNIDNTIKMEASPSFIRLSEIPQLPAVKIPQGGMENFAVDYGDFVLYFHMDNAHGGTSLHQLNHYLYNNPLKGELKYFNGSTHSLIPYNEWANELHCKDILVFGMACPQPSVVSENLSCVEPSFVFMGWHRGKMDIDNLGNFMLELQPIFRLNLK